MSKYLSLFVVLALFMAGCSPSDDRISVSGTVLADGTPLGGASVAFVGNEGGTFASATTAEDGTFTLRAAPGRNKVSVNKIDPSTIPVEDPDADQTMGTEEEVAAMMKNAPKTLVAARFADPDQSGIVIEVVPGMDSVDLNVTSK
ncbi:MAG: carboxypeptidase-like regulatory domain-containing protein [Pirellulaceae bacterium]